MAINFQDQSLWFEDFWFDYMRKFCIHFYRGFLLIFQLLCLFKQLDDISLESFANEYK